MSEQARIALTIRGNTFEISGPENFVTAQVEAFRAAILSALNGAADAPKEKSPAEKQLPPAAPHNNQTSKQTYPNVLHIEGDKVQILKSVPGTTTSKKAINTALLYLWAKRESGTGSVPFSEIRDLCEGHGCLDSPNFNVSMKNAKSWFVVEGIKHSKSKTCKLTVPGVEKAEELLKELNGEQSP
jgi:hypothetical protein